MRKYACSHALAENCTQSQIILVQTQGLSKLDVKEKKVTFFYPSLEIILYQIIKI